LRYVSLRLYVLCILVVLVKLSVLCQVIGQKDSSQEDSWCVFVVPRPTYTIYFILIWRDIACLLKSAVKFNQPTNETTSVQSLLLFSTFHWRIFQQTSQNSFIQPSWTNQPTNQPTNQLTINVLRWVLPA